MGYREKMKEINRRKNYNVESNDLNEIEQIAEDAETVEESAKPEDRQGEENGKIDPKLLKEIEENNQKDNDTYEEFIEKIREAASEKTTEEVSYRNTTTHLLPEYEKFLRIRARQLGFTYKDYINLLIDEERERNKGKEIPGFYEKYSQRYVGRKSVVGLALTENNYHYVRLKSCQLGVKDVVYFHYILEEEMKREKKNGKRKGKYDNFDF